MKQKLILPFAVSCVLSVGVGWALQLLITSDYLRGAVRYLVIGCAVLLLVAVWFAFLGELLDFFHSSRKEQIQAQKQQAVEELTAAAALDEPAAEPAEEADAPHLPQAPAPAAEPEEPESPPEPEPAAPDAADAAPVEAPANPPAPASAEPVPQPEPEPAPAAVPAAAPSAGPRPSARESARAMHAQAEAAKREQELQRVQEGASRRLAQQAARRKAEQEKLEAQRQKALEQAAQIQQARRQKNGNP